MAGNPSPAWSPGTGQPGQDTHSLQAAPWGPGCRRTCLGRRSPVAFRPVRRVGPGGLGSVQPSGTPSATPAAASSSWPSLAISLQASLAFRRATSQHLCERRSEVPSPLPCWLMWVGMALVSEGQAGAQHQGQGQQGHHEPHFLPHCVTSVGPGHQWEAGSQRSQARKSWPCADTDRAWGRCRSQAQPPQRGHQVRQPGPHGPAED